MLTNRFAILFKAILIVDTLATVIFLSTTSKSVNASNQSTTSIDASILSKGGHNQPSIVTTPKLPEVLGDTLPGATYPESCLGCTPPDSMGVIGPYQFLFTLNGVFKAFNKTTHQLVFQESDYNFWLPVLPQGFSPTDPRVRYDFRTQRWFITQLFLPPQGLGLGNADEGIAVSSGPDLSNVTWSRYVMPTTGSTKSEDHDCVADFDTLGIDQSALYIGINMFMSGNPSNPDCFGLPIYKASSIYIVNKAQLLAGSLSYKPFYDIVGGCGGNGLYTPQGVDSYDSLPSGYFVFPYECDNPVDILTVARIDNPGSSSPSLNFEPAIYLPMSEKSTIEGVQTYNNKPSYFMDDIDNRLSNAVLRNGHIWVAQTIAVNQQGNSSNGGDRDSVRWYDIDTSNWTVNQAGTLFDNTTPSGGAPTNYWMGSIMVSGQGHALIGANAATKNSVVYAGTAGHLASDGLGVTHPITLTLQSTADKFYDLFSPPNPTRWGDYSYTSLDPCDDMTMWTVQEYVAGSTGDPNTSPYWGVTAQKFLAPPPAVLPSSSAVTVPFGQSVASLVLNGSSPNGEEFYDTSSATTDPSCRKRLTASATDNIVVTGITYVSPNRLFLTLSTVNANPGTAAVTITNPDGQSVSTTIGVIQSHIDTIGVFRKPLFLLRLHNTTGYADIVASFSNGSQPYPIVGDWKGQGFDTIGDYDRSNGQFFLSDSNTSPAINHQFVLGNPNDEPIAGRWTSGATTFGPGVFRPTNGLLLLKNALSTGFADYVMVLGIPGDQGLADDWNGDLVDSPGVYRPSSQLFLLSDQVCNCSVYADYVLQLGNPNDVPFVGDWIAQGHAGVGVFRPSSGLILLKNQLLTGYADIVITYGIPNDVPVAGHWTAIYPPVTRSPGNVLVPPTSQPILTATTPSNLGG